jgi:hypothetical protein
MSGRDTRERHQYDVHGFEWSYNAQLFVALYIIIGGTAFADNFKLVMSCSIQPQLLNVSVTYNYTGVVNIEPLPETLVDLPVDSTSSTISSIIKSLDDHLSNAQSTGLNLMLDPIYTIFDDYQINAPSQADLTTQQELIVSLCFSTISRD